MEEKYLFTLNGLGIFLALVPVFGDITIKSSIPRPSSTNLIFTKTEKQWVTLKGTRWDIPKIYSCRLNKGLSFDWQKKPVEHSG